MNASNLMGFKTKQSKKNCHLIDVRTEKSKLIELFIGNDNECGREKSQ